MPIALTGKDIAGQAQTGTGKTAAFLIATFSRLLTLPPMKAKNARANCPRALIIAPTRELVVQIRDEAESLGKYCDLKLHAVFGGVDYNKQMKQLEEGVDVLVGTPGRLIDYFKQKIYSLEATDVLVIDEADRMFDMGFIDDVRYLVRRMPKPDKRQSFLYSATLSYRVLELAYEHMNRVERIAVHEENVTADNVEEMVCHVGKHEKIPMLLGLLEREKPTRALIFVNMRSTAARLADQLIAQGYPAGALAGDIDQRKRLRLLAGLKDGSLRFLVATDVASRGLHIESVSHVFNYDLPQDPEDYVHRIGRTARAGQSGKAFSLACEQYVYSLDAIQEYVGRKIEHEFADPELFIKPVYVPRSSRRPRGSDRSSSRRSAKSGSGDNKRSSQPRSRGNAGNSGEKRTNAANKDASGSAAGGSSDGPAKKKRRRRRRSSKNPVTRDASSSTE